jgi:hypothetical protein
MSGPSRRWLARGGITMLVGILFWTTAILASETPIVASLGVNVHGLGLADYTVGPGRPLAPLSNRIVNEANQDARAFNQPEPSNSSAPSANSGLGTALVSSPSPTSTVPSTTATPTATPIPTASSVASGATGWLQGRVQDSTNNQGIVGALVQAAGASTATDSTGAYQLTVPAGSYSVTASATGYTSQTQATTVVAGTGVKLNFSLRPITVSPGTIDGVVYNGQTGVGIGGATVSLSPIGLVTITNGSGGYIFGTVPAGTYTISAGASGFHSASATVSVTSGHNSVVNLKLQPMATTGSLVGTVKGSNNKGLAGATVTVSPGGLSTVTDSSGYYAFASLLPGTYTVTVSATGYLTQSATVTIQAGHTTKANFSLVLA